MKKNIFFTAVFLIMIQAAHAQSWSLAGNAAVSGNVLGTTNAFPLNFILDGRKGGIVEGTYTGSHYNTGIGFLCLQNASGSNPPIENTALGYAALGGISLTGSFNVANGATTLQYNTTGQYNTGIGRQTLNYNTTGSYNLANGGQSLYTNVTGSNNTAVGYGTLYSSTVSNLTAVGYEALYSNTTGTGNVATGYQSLYFNTTGYQNTANGNKALYSNTTGSYNAATGYQTLYFNTTGSYNAATAYQSLYSNTTGNDNTADGYSALYYNTTGSYNTGNGYFALLSNTTGNYNTANGHLALVNNTTGNENTANGESALAYNTTGSNNTANGNEALYYNTTGTQNTANGVSSLGTNTTGGYNTATGAYSLGYNSTGNYNTANGNEALYDNTTGNSNTANGNGALQFNTTGGYNTAHGEGALEFNTRGIYNTANGGSALNYNTSGSNNTGDGYNANVNDTSYTDAGAFGYDALATASYQVRIGDNQITSIGGYANWTNISDGRVKKNILQNVPGLTFINQLQPVTYNLNLDAADKIVEPPVHKDAKGNTIQPTQEQLAARSAKEQIVYTGFIAQDVEKAAQKVSYNFSGVDAAKNSKDLYGLRYAEFVVPLVKAVQELSAINEVKDAKIDTLQQQLNDLKSTVAQMQSAMSQCCNSFSSGMQSAVSNISDQPKLDQNVPNPFNGSSYISYYIPQGFHSAQLMVVDISGHTLKTFALANSGYGKQVISGSEMAAGMYQYSLLIDGKLIDTKKMVKAN